MSASLYGRFFWETALEGLRESIASSHRLNDQWVKLLSSPVRQQSRQAMEEIYAKNPKLAPTPAERRAQQLRDQADDIENQETLSKLTAMTSKNIAAAQPCQQVIVARLRAT